MVPVSTLRETLFLVIFGIVLVPIAAKRAQDAPGYWKAFAGNAQALAHSNSQPPLLAFVLCTSCGDAASAGRHVKPYTLRNGTTSATIEPRPGATEPLTLRLRLSKSKPEDPTATTQVVAEANAAKVSTGTLAGPKITQ
ncbi:hypothetical protein KVR01_000290 [Diaporthe batatas]|uniref:uncharacterized protein n=1 Tax=Diaporthe batatas TaxID=748121 RepID=UPI001D059835|nr:uncharacterized protein KVR01_000290 [Diaporthe batatas]KAG8169545.1 hypothetical protein KVR01_000290 [Diaporthe batatas]